MLSQARQIVVGLVAHHPGESELGRTMARVELTFHAKIHDFLLAETFELRGHPGQDRATLRAVQRCLHESDARVLLVHGDVDRGLLEPMTVSVVPVSQPPPVGAA
jgi:hypothetical protein